MRVGGDNLSASHRRGRRAGGRAGRSGPRARIARAQTKSWGRRVIGKRPLAAARDGQGKVAARPARGLRSGRRERPARRSSPRAGAVRYSVLFGAGEANASQDLLRPRARRAASRERATTEHVGRLTGRRWLRASHSERRDVAGRAATPVETPPETHFAAERGQCIWSVATTC